MGTVWVLVAATATFGPAAAGAAAVGVLTQKAGTAGCISEDGTGGACQEGDALGAANSVAVSPDGTSAYVTGGHAVAVFDRNPGTGALTQKAGTAGCISDTGSAGDCVDGTVLSGAFGVAVSPDGQSVYAVALLSSAVVVFDRNPATGALTQKAETAGCVSDDGSGGTCQDGAVLENPSSIGVSPDGASVYVASFFSDAVRCSTAPRSPVR